MLLPFFVVYDRCLYFSKVITKHFRDSTCVAPSEIILMTLRSRIRSGKTLGLSVAACELSRPLRWRGKCCCNHGQYCSSIPRFRVVSVIHAKLDRTWYESHVRWNETARLLASRKSWSSRADSRRFGRNGSGGREEAGNRRAILYHDLQSRWTESTGHVRPEARGTTRNSGAIPANRDEITGDPD